MRRHGCRLTGALASVLIATAVGSASAEPRNNCFPSGVAWQSWSAAENGDVLYFRVHLNDIYRVDLTPGSRVYKSPGYFLVNRVRGSDWICSALDLDLMLSSTYGDRKPLIAVAMRKLTPAEIKAIPRKDLP